MQRGLDDFPPGQLGGGAQQLELERFGRAEVGEHAAFREVRPVGELADGRAREAVAADELEAVALDWGRTICGKSPTATRMFKFGMNLIDDGLIGQQVFAGEATRLIYGTDEAQEGRDSFLEKRDPDWSGAPYHY